MKTINYIKLNYQLLRLIIPVFLSDGKSGPAKVS
jgi:hypothetical protein